MMDRDHKALLGLPLTNAEREWLTDRLETLSVKESYAKSTCRNPQWTGNEIYIRQETLGESY